MRKFLIIAVLSLGAFSANADLISETDIINNWSAEADPLSGLNINNASWGQSGNTIINGGNRSGSLVSDFTQTTDFSFSTIAQATSFDNDLFGVVFGWQDSDNTYALGWGGGGVGGGFALNGIGLYSVVGGVRTTLAATSLIWSLNTNYTLTVGRSGSTITAMVDDGVSTLFSASIVDTNFTSGNVGFTTFSQNSTFSFGATDFTATTAVPEPGSLALLVIGLAGVGFARRSRKT